MQREQAGRLHPNKEVLAGRTNGELTHKGEHKAERISVKDDKGLGHTRAASPGQPSPAPPRRPGRAPRGSLTSKGGTLGKVTSMTSTPGRPWEVRMSPTCRATVLLMWQGTATRAMVPGAAAGKRNRLGSWSFPASPAWTLLPRQPELQLPGCIGTTPASSANHRRSRRARAEVLAEVGSFRPIISRAFRVFRVEFLTPTRKFPCACLA